MKNFTRYFPHSCLLDDLPLLVEVQHHPDAISSLVDLFDVVLSRDFCHLTEHILQLGCFPFGKTLLSARRRSLHQYPDKLTWLSIHNKSLRQRFSSLAKMFSFSWPTENTKYTFNYHILVKISFSQDNLTVPHQKNNRSRGLMGASRRCKQTGN